MSNLPIINKGHVNIDKRGKLFYNNTFNSSDIKRIYIIENKNNLIKRGWVGHKIEKRWFCAINGAFKVLLIKIDNWKKPDINLIPQEFILKSNSLDFLFIPEGYVTNIKSLEKSSKLLVLADYLFEEIKDDYRFDQNYFSNNYKFNE